MNEIQRIIQLFEDLFDGTPWLDITINKTLEGLTASQASRRVIPGSNSIAEIVNHMIAWRQNVLKRLQGEVIVTPKHNYFFLMEDVTENDWATALEKLNATQMEWTQFLKDLKEEDLLKVYPTNRMTYFQHIHGMIQHDAYHLGQIVFLAKSAG